MLKILKLSFLLCLFFALHGCASIGYYEFIEPERSASQQFIDTPYVYSGSVEAQQDSNHYQFSGVLHDLDDKYLDITIPNEILIKEHLIVTSASDSKLGNNLIELSNTDVKQIVGEPALLVVNPNYPFHLDAIKNHPQGFFQKNYLKYQPVNLSKNTDEKIDCPNIVLLNIDIYEELPTTLEYGACKTKGDYSSYTWHIVLADEVANNVEHDKVFGYQIAYLGFIVTVPVDIIAASFYTLGWALVSTKNLMASGEE
jgi:hypothetical protein